ncbi:MAG: hypothetical protein CBE08_002175 [Euryarchaeota archaeon TMED248]|nr:MAG: hypothetical protein CBE08_002175 [Euryarchaeota archaeon TMED248]|tara:strand:+ start:3186 stop:5000 length:1815 start_codon:yes stop_codon:yes gene_type:complete
MRRGGVAIILGIILLSSVLCQIENDSNPSSELVDNVSLFSNSDVTITYSNGPSNGQSVTGLFTVSFSLGGTGTVSSLLVEISDGVTWTTVTNLTSSPWLTHLDSTSYDNGTYTLRATAYDSTAEESVVQTSNSFTIDNQVPEITIFTVLNPMIGTGNSANDRAWFDIESTGTLEFRWGAIDDDLLRASLVNVPGPSTPANDGPGTIAYGWDWSSGNMQEGTWNPRITVYDDSGLSASETIFIGIDRTGPSLSSVTVQDNSNWHDTSTITLSGLIISADDGQGSGIDFSEISTDGTTWTSTTSDTYVLTLNEGINSVSVRATDRVGNVGPISQLNIQIDTENPEEIGWNVEQITTDRIGPVPVEFSAIDSTSGIDTSASYIEYGFDSNGVGQTPDLSGSWQQISSTGLSGVVAQSSWITKSRQYLMLRAHVFDLAGNSITTSPASYQILPSLDFSWNISETNLDRLIVKPGENSGNVTITSLLESSESYGGGVTVQLESAPADRTSAVSWTVLESRTLGSGTLSDSSELLIWNYTVPSSGQFDLRLVIDPNNVIDEYDESNNKNHMVVTGATISSIIDAPSFAPSILMLIITSLFISYISNRTRD